MYHYSGSSARVLYKKAEEIDNMLICRPFITLKNGRRLYAHEKGLEAFCFRVTPEQHQEYLERKKKEKDTKQKDKK